MVRYLCQSCNCTYIDNHKCFFYKNYDNLCSLPHQEKLNDKHVKNAKTKDEFTDNSNGKSGKLIPVILLSDTEEWEQVSSVPGKNYENVTFKRTSKRKRNLFSLTDDTSNNEQNGKPDDALVCGSTFNVRAYEVYSEVKDSAKCSLRCFEPHCSFEKGLHGACTRKSSTTVAQYEQNSNKPISTAVHKVCGEESEKSLEEKAWQPFTDSKSFMETSVNITQNVHSDSKSVSGTSNSPNSTYFAPGDEESGKYTSEVSNDLPDIPNSPKVASRLFIRKSNMKKSLASEKEKDSDKYTLKKSRNLLDVCDQIPPKVASRVLTRRSNYVKKSLVSKIEKESEICASEVSKKQTDTSIQIEVSSRVVTRKSTKMKKPIASMKEKDSGKCTFEVSRDRTDIPILPEGPSHVLTRSTTKVKHPFVSMEEKKSDQYTFEVSRNSPDYSIPSKVASRVLTRKSASLKKHRVSMKEKESGKCTFEVSKDIPDIPLTPEVASRIPTRKSVNMKETLISKKVESSVAGPSGNHTNSLQAESKPFFCDKCHKRFSWKSTFENHYRTHTGEKPFVCDRCDKTFAHKISLKNHYRTHPGENPFVCNRCQKTSSHKLTLKNPYSIHTGKKPFVCQKCKKSFASKFSLTEHFRRHTGEKPYKCEICEKAFTRKGTHYSHYKSIQK